MNKFKLGARLGAGFAVVVVLMLVVVLVATRGLLSIGGGVDDLLKDKYVKVRLVDALNDELNHQSRSVRNVLIMDDLQQRQGELSTIQKSMQASASDFERLTPKITSREGLELLAKVVQSRKSYEQALMEFHALVSAGKVDEGRQFLLRQLRPLQLQYGKDLTGITALQEQLMERAGDEAAASISGTIWVLGVSFAVAVMVASLVAWAITRSVTAPTRVMVASLKSVASGDLGVRVQVDRGDELGELQQALADTIQNLREVVGKVRNGVESVSCAASQIAAGNQDLSIRTQQNAALVEQSAAAAGSLEQQARNLSESVAVFRL